MLPKGNDELIAPNRGGREREKEKKRLLKDMGGHSLIRSGGGERQGERFH